MKDLYGKEIEYGDLCVVLYERGLARARVVGFTDTRVRLSVLTKRDVKDYKVTAHNLITVKEFK